MWGGPQMPLWQRILFPTVVAVSAYASLYWTVAKKRPAPPRRCLALIFLLLFGYMFWSRLYIAEHHLIALLPIATVMVVLTARDSWLRWPIGRYLVVLLAFVYLASAVKWNLMAANEIRLTGGVDAWSNAITSVSSYLQRNCAGRRVKVLDWWLENGLFVLSAGQTVGLELFPGATLEHTGLGKPWTDEIAPGNVYVLRSSELMPVPDARKGFIRAMAMSALPVRRTDFPQKQGSPYAQVFEVLPQPSPN